MLRIKEKAQTFKLCKFPNVSGNSDKKFDERSTCIELEPSQSWVYLKGKKKKKPITHKKYHNKV